MTDDDKLTAEAPEATAEERVFFDAVLEAARRDRAPQALGERVLDRIAYRARLHQHAAPPRSPRRTTITALGVGLAVAAVLAIALRPRESSSPITPEQAQAPAHSAAPTAPPKKVAPDPCLERRSAPGLAPLIDDFEDGDDAITHHEQRVGFWRWPREIDAPGTAPALMPQPRPEPTPRSRLALHVKGGELVDWGATVEFTFRPACYDASKYAGVAFAARGPGRIYFAAREPHVIPIDEGGTCEVDCHNPHVMKIDLDDTFKSYEVRWEQTRQRGKGKPALDPSRLNSIAFLVRPEDTPYDVWLDDVAFINR